MFYLEVERYTQQKRQHELAKDLKLRRWLRDLEQNKTDNQSYFVSDVSDRLRNLVLNFNIATRISNGQVAPGPDCVTC